MHGPGRLAESWTGGTQTDLLADVAERPFHRFAESRELGLNPGDSDRGVDEIPGIGIFLEMGAQLPQPRRSHIPATALQRVCSHRNRLSVALGHRFPEGLDFDRRVGKKCSGDSLGRAGCSSSLELSKLIQRGRIKCGGQESLSASCIRARVM